MTKVRLSFRAQSLDNTAPDIISKGGELLSPSDAAARQEVIREIYDIVSDKTVVYAKLKLVLYCKGLRFALEISLPETDKRGRVSPIVACGILDNVAPRYWVPSVILEIRKFCQVIGRTIPDKTLEDVEDGLQILWDEKKKKIGFTELFIIVSISILQAILLKRLFPIISTEVILLNNICITLLSRYFGEFFFYGKIQSLGKH